MAALAACEGQQAGSAAVPPAGKVQQAGMVPADEPAAFPGERLVPASVVPGPSVLRPMGLQSDPQCQADLLRVLVALQSLEPQGEVGSIWRSPVVGGQAEAEALLIPVPQRW